MQTDIKSALSFASLTQVGIIVAEIGLGFRYVALIHLLGHACLRTLQFVRAPTLLHDYHTLENAIGEHLPTAGVPLGPARRPARAGTGSIDWPSSRAISTRSLSDYLVGPFVRAFRWCDALERRWTDFLSGEASRESDQVKPHFRNDRRVLMNPLSLPWLEMSIAGHALVGSLCVSRLREPIRAYRWGLAFTGTAFVCTLLAWLGFYLRIPVPSWPRRYSLQSVLVRPADLRAGRAERTRWCRRWP